MKIKHDAQDLALAVAAGEYRTGQQQMLPDQTLFWRRYALPDRLGELLLPNDYQTEVLSELVRLALRPPRLANLLLPHGDFACIKRVGDVALKIFNRNNPVNHSGKLAHSANVALAVGLQRRQSRVGSARLLAPRQLGALLRPGAKNQPSVWAMSFEDGRLAPITTWFEDGAAAREAEYKAALQACGVRPAAVAVDDKPANTIIRRSVDPAALLDIVKFDLYVPKDVTTLD